jgi:phage shock protein C
MTDPMPQPSRPAPRRLARSDDRWLSGVCGGIAEFAGLDPNLVRLLVVIGAVIAFPAVVIGYLIAWVLLPER